MQESSLQINKIIRALIKLECDFVMLRQINRNLLQVYGDFSKPSPTKLPFFLIKLCLIFKKKMYIYDRRHSIKMK